MTSYQTPENVQRSAEDYINLGKEESAFSMLVDYMSGKKPRQWSQAMEKIMIMLIDLAIKFDKKAALREPLNNYKFASQFNNITSFETVLIHFAKSQEDKHENIFKLATAEILDMEDLESQDPFELFISSLDVDSRTERSIIRASMRSIWETYKMILEISSRNKKLEELYGQVAHRAFEFCRKYKRRSEFKRLCESIHSNLMSIMKAMATNPDFNKIAFAIDLSNQETNEKQILVRFDMLEYTQHFNLTQETIRVLDDIHNIMQKSRTQIRPKVLSDYFEQTAKMFWNSGFYWYHAVAYFNHFSLLRTKNKNMSSEELTQKSCNFVLAVLCIPPLSSEATQSEDARQRAISFLSSGSSVPTKQELITYINKHNILDLCSESIREIYYLIEESKNVVSLTKNSEPLLKSIGDSFGAYRTQLQTVIVYKLLGLLSQLYTKIKIDSFVRFLGFLDYAFCENIIHIASNADHIKVRIDHKRRLLVFQDDVQDMQSLSLKFVNFSEDLKDVIYSIDNSKEEGKEAKALTTLKDDARRFVESSTTALKRRFDLINQLKRPFERDNAKQQNRGEERGAGRGAEVPVRNAEREQAAIDYKRKMAKIEDSLAAYNRSRKEQLIKQLRGVKAFKIDKKRIEDMTAEELDNLSLDKLEKEKEEFEKREKEKEEAAIRNGFKRTDYLERARREEFIGQIKKTWENAKGEKDEIMKVHKENFTQHLEFKKKMQVAQQFRQQVVTKVLEERTEAFEEDMQEFREKIIEDFKSKLLELAQESLKAQIDSEEADKKQKEAEAAKEKARLEEERENQAKTQTDRLTTSTGFERSNIMRSTDDTKMARGAPREDDKKSGPTSVITRGGPRPEPTASAQPTGGFARNTDFKPKEESKTGESKPRFLNAKKEGEETKRPAFGFGRSANPEPEKQTSTVADDGWRTASKPEPTKKDDGWRTAEKSTSGNTGGSGFARGGPSATQGSTGGPSKGFSRGPASGASKPDEKKDGGSGFGGWRK